MKATAAFLNDTVLAGRARKLTGDDRRAVRVAAVRRANARPGSLRADLVAVGAAALAAKDWPETVTRYVARLVIHGVGDEDWAMLARLMTNRANEGSSP